MSFQLPPIVQLAERLLDEIERSVARFSRMHKYTMGADLRRCAMDIALLAQRAWREPSRRADWLDALASAVDEIKLRLQVGSRLRIFASFGQFEAIIRVAADLGRQVGGWKKQQHPKSQNRAAVAPHGRAQILSTRTASHREANR